MKNVDQFCFSSSFAVETETSLTGSDINIYESTYNKCSYMHTQVKFTPESFFYFTVRADYSNVKYFLPQNLFCLYPFVLHWGSKCTQTGGQPFD